MAARHRRGTVRGLAALTAVWGLSAGLSLQLIPGSPVASASATGLAVAQVRATQAALADPRVFGQATRSPDPEAAVPASDLLTGLRGKDVLIVFVESYGQVAVQGTSFSPGVDAVLRQQNGMLTSAGWSTQSAWLTSPTFGGISWLAHSTLQSGLWVNSNQRYDELLASQRFTLSDAFDKAGWHTVADDPSDNTTWTPGTTFYHYDQTYNRLNVGYKGPTFSYSAMPDQYTLAEFQRLELTPGHKPVMAEIDLTSSHIPWAPLPAMVPWNKVGNGSVFRPPARGERVRGAGLEQHQHRAPVLRPVDPVLDDRPHFMGHRAERPEPRAHPARRPPAPHHRQRHRAHQRRADLDHHPRPVGTQADVLLALAERAAARFQRSARAHGRLPQPVPQHLQQQPPGPGCAGARIRRSPGSRGERDLGAVTSMTLGWDNPTADPTTTILLRHGDTRLSPEHRFSGQRDLPLSASGTRQAKAAACRLAAGAPIDAVVSSPLQRAVDTAAIAAAELGLTTVIDDDLRETDFGDWDGFTLAEIQQRWPAAVALWRRDPEQPPPGGESFADTAQRVNRACDRLLRDHSGQTVLVVSHISPIKILLCRALGVPLDTIYRLYLGSACINKIQWHGREFAAVHSVNDTSHLP